MTARRRICVVSGTRADYGHLKWIMHDLAQDDRVELQVLVTGTHLSPHHGQTVTEIEGDGFAIAARVDMLLAGDSPVAVAKSMGLGVMGFAEAFQSLHPELIVLLGDRYEALAAAQAATLLSIPIAHIHGGEASEGTMDESLRHAITKLSHLHFVAAPAYGRRVRQMGEAPERIFAFGAPGVDHFERTSLPERAELEAFLGLVLESPLLLVTYHPATLAELTPVQAARNLCAALDAFPSARVVFTGVNADPGGAAMETVLRSYTLAHSDRMRVYTSLGYSRYLGLMRLTDVVVGNSSSGLIEAPVAGVATVNIGDRQRGRLTSAAVVSCSPSTEAITAAIADALSPQTQALAHSADPAYGRPGASRKIAEALARVELKGVLVKPFIDLPEEVLS